MNTYRVIITLTNACGEFEGDETLTETHWVEARSEAMACMLVGVMIECKRISDFLESVVNVTATLETN